MDTPSLVLRFDHFEIDVEAGEIRRYGRRIKLQEKPFQVLLALLERPGRPLSREELCQRLWPDNTFVDFEHNLNNAIDKLRKALSDSSEQPRFIETLPRRGYRFIARVESISTASRRAESEVGPASDLPAVTGNAVAAQSRLGTPYVRTPVPEVLGRSRQVHASRALTGLLLLIAVLTAAVTGLRKGRNWPKTGIPQFERLLVLPIENLTGISEREYLADGLTEGLISRLGELDPDSLSVIAPATAMRLKGSSKSPDQIGRELNLSYVLASTLRSSRHGVRLSVQLIRVNDQAQVWTAEYERDEDNLVGIPNEVAAGVAPRLHLTASGMARNVEGTSDNEAYQDYLRGRFFWNRRLKEDVLKAIDYFSKAASSDPKYAKAYAGLADCYIVLAGSHMPARAAFSKARENAEKAIYLDESLAEAHTSLAYVMYADNWDWPRAEREYRRALALDPEYATAHHWYFLYLQSMRRFPEAVGEAETALRLDPLSQSINNNAAAVYMFAGQNDRAVRQLNKAIELDPRNPVAYGYLGILYEREGKFEEAAKQFEKAESFETQKYTYGFEIAGAYARSGRMSDARRLAKQLELYSQTHYVNPYWAVTMYAGFGDQERLFLWLQRAVAERSCTAAEINDDARLDFVRSDPRFHKILADMHLPTR